MSEDEHKKSQKPRRRKVPSSNTVINDHQPKTEQPQTEQMEVHHHPEIEKKRPEGISA